MTREGKAGTFRFFQNDNDDLNVIVLKEFKKKRSSIFSSAYPWKTYEQA